MSTLEEIIEEWEELRTDYQALESTKKVYEEKLVEVANEQANCVKNISHQRYRMSDISRKLKKIKNIGDVDKSKIKLLEQSMSTRKLALFQIEDTLPKPNGRYLRIIIGNVNVSILNKEAKFKYKDEYEKFKLILNGILFFLSIINLQTQIRALELVNIFLLVWYYCTLTIRESILKVNGSRIKGWWRLHHFILTVAMGVLLIWPDLETWLLFKCQFMWFNSYISFVQYLQFRYQRGQLYRMKALGERDNMDITVDGFHSWMWRGLGFLLPFLFGAYGFQFYNSYTLYKLSYLPSATWHIPVLSLLFFVLFLGNFTTTMMVLPRKTKDRINRRLSLINEKEGTPMSNNFNKQE